jgi:hypothetical protein
VKKTTQALTNHGIMWNNAASKIAKQHSHGLSSLYHSAYDRRTQATLKKNPDRLIKKYGFHTSSQDPREQLRHLQTMQNRHLLSPNLSRSEKRQMLDVATHVYNHLNRPVM